MRTLSVFVLLELVQLAATLALSVQKAPVIEDLGRPRRLSTKQALLTMCGPASEMAVHTYSNVDVIKSSPTVCKLDFPALDPEEGAKELIVDEAMAEVVQQQAEVTEGRENSLPSDAAYGERLRCFRELHVPTEGSPRKTCTCCGHAFSLTAFKKDRVVKGVQYLRSKCEACRWRNLKVDRMLQNALTRHRERKYAGEPTIDREWLEAELARPGLECPISGLRGTDRASGLPWMWSIDEIEPGKGYHPDNCRLIVMEMNVRGGHDGERLIRKQIVDMCKSVIARLNGGTKRRTQEEFDEWYRKPGVKEEVRRLIARQRGKWLQTDRARGLPTMTLEEAILRFEEQRGECTLSYQQLPLEGIARFSGDGADNIEGHEFDNVNFVLGFLNCIGIRFSEEEGGGVGEGMSERKMAQLVLGQQGKPEFDDVDWTPRVLLELEKLAAMPAPRVNKGGSNNDAQHKRGKKARPSSFKDGPLATLKELPVELERANQ